ncbi:MAG: AI-2E family transporter [Lachnospiraceae bacterium]|nr:AI-2E family transporter [Lachnospiraceae bacterium]
MKESDKRIYGLIVFTAVVALAVIHFNSLIGIVGYIFSVLTPFIIGGAIAFVLNIPMSSLEKKLFGNAKGKKGEKFARPCSILITFVLFIAVITIICFTVIPQLRTAISILKVEIPAFLEQAYEKIRIWFQSNQYILDELEKLKNMQVNWDELFDFIIGFLGNGVGTTAISNAFNIAGSIIGGVVNVFVAIIFSIYILASKEKLQGQASRIIRAFCSAKIVRRTEKILRLLQHSFRNFITGQFLEAIILGLLFLVVLFIGGFDYALLISILIAVTSLIPIVGAFIGCFVGAFLIMVEDPLRALIFLVIFLIIQQIEGNLIYPKVVGSSVGLPSMWVLAAVTVGGSLAGVMGMLVFIPLMATGYALLREITAKRLEKKAREEMVASEAEPETKTEITIEIKTENTSEGEE